MTESLAQWIPKKMTWGDLCAVASAAADLLNWLADRDESWAKKQDRRLKNNKKTTVEKSVFCFESKQAVVDLRSKWNKKKEPSKTFKI